MPCPYGKIKTASSQTGPIPAANKRRRKMCSMLVNKVDFLHGFLGVQSGLMRACLWKTPVENPTTR